MTMAHSSRRAGLGGRAWAARNWLIWRERRPAVIYVMVIVALALGLGGIAIARARLHLPDLLTFVALVLCAAACIEGTRRLGEPSGLFKDMFFAWGLAIMVWLPPMYAWLLPIPIGILTQLRVKRSPVYRRVFTMAAKALSGVTTSFAFHLGLRHWVSGDAGVWQDHLAVFILFAVVCGALCMALNQLLVAYVVRLAVPETRWSEVLWDKESAGLELVELCVGLLVVLAVAMGLPLVAFAVPPVLLLHRAQMHAQLRTAARTDAKTGLLNVTTWQIEAESELSRASRAEASTALLLIDLDHFKQVNDRHGHLTGDRVLVAVADLLGDQLRDYDLIGRFGGEEFIVLLPQTDAAEASRVAERLRVRTAGLDISDEDRQIKVTVSVGVALRPTHGDDLRELIAAADVALYHAKATGRNRVCMPAGSGDGSGVDGRLEPEAHRASSMVADLDDPPGGEVVRPPVKHPADADGDSRREGTRPTEVGPQAGGAPYGDEGGSGDGERVRSRWHQAVSPDGWHEALDARPSHTVKGADADER